MRVRIAILAGGLVLAMNAAAGAAGVAQDTFESYTPGSQLNGQNGGTGFTGPYVVDPNLLANVTVTTRALNYANGSVASNGGSNAVSIADAANSNNLISRPFTAQTGTVYYSFLLTSNSAGTEDDFFQVGLSGTATGEPPVSVGASFQTSPGAGPMQYYARVPAGAANASFGTTPVNYNGTATNFLVAKVSKVNGSSTYNQVDLFVNPSSGTEPTATITRTAAADAAGEPASLSNFIFRTARLDAGDLYTFDNLTIGTTYADVVPVPEPASAGLLALAATGLLAQAPPGVSGGEAGPVI